MGSSQKKHNSAASRAHAAVAAAVLLVAAAFASAAGLLLVALLFPRLLQRLPLRRHFGHYHQVPVKLPKPLVLCYYLPKQEL